MWISKSSSWATLILLAVSTSLVRGELHNLAVGSFSTNHLFILQFDNTTNSLSLVKTVKAHSGHPWLALSWDKQTLYASERDGWSSYAMTGVRDLTFVNNVTLRTRCDGTEFRHGTTSLIASKKFPFSVYGSGRSPCGAVLSVRADGSLEGIIQDIKYTTSSRIQGMVFDASGRILFSADQRGNGIWTHRVDPKTGKLDRGTFTEIPIEDTRPSRLALHPSENYLYVLLSKINRVGLYQIQQSPSGIPTLKSLGMDITLIPRGVDEPRYQGQELLFSADGNILYASSRYRWPREGDDGYSSEEEEFEPVKPDEDDAGDGILGWLSSLLPGSSGGRRGGGGPPGGGNRGGRPIPGVENTRYSNIRKRQTPIPGFLTAILLTSPENPPLRGFPLQMLMQASTTTSGGRSNFVSPAPWANGYFALTDSEVGVVQVWRVDGLDNLPLDGPRRGIPQLTGAKSPYSNKDPLSKVRASIVAEWKAPAEAIGDPKVSGGDGWGWGRPMGGLFNKRDGMASATTGAMQAISSGKGCCAHALWLD